MAFRLITEPAGDVFIAHLAADFLQQVTETLKHQQRFTWVLSGGNTPRSLYQALARDPYRSAIPWSRLWIFWGDERTVAPDHPDSNFHMTEDALLRHVPIPSQQIFRMKGELPPAQAATEYEHQLQHLFGAKDLPVFDLLLLGMGPDGHTASLFPSTPALTVKNHWVTENPVAKLNTVRLTLTLPVINHAAAIWFLATGADKAEAFAHVRSGPSAAYPASLVVPDHGQLQWYVDPTILQRPE